MSLVVITFDDFTDSTCSRCLDLVGESGDFSWHQSPKGETDLVSEDLQSSYDRVAEDYAGHFRDEIDKKPFDRKMLDWLAEKVSDLGMICDMGCGPGQIARYLYDHGTQACGIDLSMAMIERKRKLNPETPFRQGDMLALNGMLTLRRATFSTIRR